LSKEIEVFMRACRTGNVEKISRALEKGIDVDCRDENKLTGLIWAGRKGKIESAIVLLDAGADLENGDNRNRTSLFHAVTYDRQDYIKYLVSKGADVNVTDTHGWSPLDFAESSQFEQMAALLVELGGVSSKNA